MIKMRLGSNIDVDNVLMDPTRFYSHPAAVVEVERLSREQKRRILQSWALDADLINEAESEYMRGRAGDRCYLRKARLAPLALDV